MLQWIQRMNYIGITVLPWTRHLKYTSGKNTAERRRCQTCGRWSDDAFLLGRHFKTDTHKSKMGYMFEWTYKKPSDEHFCLTCGTNYLDHSSLLRHRSIQIKHNHLSLQKGWQRKPYTRPIPKIESRTGYPANVGYILSGRMAGFQRKQRKGLNGSSGWSKLGQKSLLNFELNFEMKH